MAKSFSMDEILGIAEQIEVIASDFYRNAAARASTRDVGRLLKDLADMEELHRQVFAQMRSRLPGGTDEDLAVDAELQALAEKSVFDAGLRVTPDQSFEGVLEVAVELEARSIHFYEKLHDFLPSPQDHASLSQIIEEEKRHLKLLSSTLDDVRSKVWTD